MYKIYTRTGVLKKHIRKILFIMRLTTIIILAAMLQVSASSFAQKVTYIEKKGSLLKLFKEIKKQTGFNVVWSEDKLNVAASLNANFRKAPLEEVMTKSLDDLDFTYVIVKKTIVIKEKELSLFDKVIRKFQSIEVRGIVKGENDEPLSGASIRVKGASNSTTANNKGEFVLKAVEQNAILVISYLGYEPKEILAKPDLGVVKLEISSSGLKEIEINAGYYKVKDRERTGSISKVTAETIGQQPVNNPIMALQGNVSGVQITQQTGVPGGAFKIQIRGQNSISNGNDPLYIIDGVNYPSTKISGDGTSTILGTGGASPLSLINPGDIESIEVLKDADATAIYGSRGANGVILITTKKGKAGETKVNALFSQGLSQVGHHVDLLNTQQYIMMRKEAYSNGGLNPGPTDYDVNGIWDQNKYTDWQKELIGGTAQRTDASLNVSGGNTKSNYLISGNYYKEGTVYPGDFGFKRYSMRSNINLGSAQDRFNASFIGNFSRTQSNLFFQDLTTQILLAPNAPDPYDQYGNLNWQNNTVSFNPMALLLQTNDATTDELLGNLTLSYKILKNLVLKTSLGYSSIKRQELLKYPLDSYPPIYGYTSAQRISNFGNNYNNNFIAEPVLSYQEQLGPGKIDALVGMSFQDNNAQLNVISAKDFASDDLMGNMSSAATLTNNQNDLSKYRYTAAFARINYSIKSRYFINLTGRRDGSSRFGPDRQFANFGAVGAAWVFSQENLIMEKLPFLSFGKLRGSYGITGNDQIPNYGYLQLWNTNTYGTYQGTSTIAPTSLAPNANFGWETNRKLEAALQVGFLKDKINVEISYYRNRSSNQLIAQNLPFSTGQGVIVVNLPAEVQNTGWEFDSSYHILKTNNWTWSAGFNLTIPKNTLLSYPGLETSSNAINYQIGQPLSILKAYNVTVNPQTGVYVIEDKNGNNTIDNGDRYLTEFLGKYFYGGLQNSVRYKQFNLDFQFSFTKQNGRSYLVSSSQTPGRGLPLTTISNQFTEVLGRWQEPGDQTSIQKFTTISANNTLNSNMKSYGNLSIVDASYIRLKNVSLSYALPHNFLTALKITNASVSLQGQNLYTFTNYIGLDPETSGFNLPPLRTLALGLNVTF